MWTKLIQFFKRVDQQLTQGVYEHGHHLSHEPESSMSMRGSARQRANLLRAPSIGELSRSGHSPSRLEDTAPQGRRPGLVPGCLRLAQWTPAGRQ